jgi:hypothetical protein
MSVITLPISFIVMLILFAIYGLFLSAVIFVVAVANMVQRRTMHAEVKRYASLLELANTNLQLLNERKERQDAQVVRIDGADLHLGGMVTRRQDQTE